MSKSPPLPSEMVKFAAECNTVVGEYESLFSKMSSLLPVQDWLKEVREIISEMESLLEDLQQPENRSEVCAELEELFTALEDTLDSHPDGHRVQNATTTVGTSDELAELIDRICERTREVGYSFHSRIQDAHLW